MKAEQRKELERNALRENLRELAEALKKKPSNRTLILCGIGVLVALLFAGFVLLRKGSSEGVSSRWAKLDSISSLNSVSDLEPFAKDDAKLKALIEEHKKNSTPLSPAELDQIREELLQKFIEDYRGTTAARTARFEEARYRLEHGVQNLGNKDHYAYAVENLKKARDLYEQLAPESGDTPVLVQEAMMGAAKAEEALAATSEGNLDRAVELYEKLAKAYPDSFQGKAAEARAKELREKGDQIKAFYAKLKEDATKK